MPGRCWLPALTALLAGCGSPPGAMRVTVTAAGGLGASEPDAEVHALADALQPDVHLAVGDLAGVFEDAATSPIPSPSPRTARANGKAPRR